MRLKTGATEVALRTSQLLRAVPNNRGKLEAPILEPTWYRVVLANPPTQQLYPRVKESNLRNSARTSLRRQTADGFWVTRNKRTHNTNSSHLYKLRKIQFPEDKIRDLFYRSHPWEMARPRNIIESNGTTLADCDWSSLHQDHIQLSGESVVRHALWLADQPDYRAEHGSDWRPAYDIARQKFYKLRMHEFASHQVAAEEAAMVGAVFGPSSIEVGINAEQKVIDQYLVAAKDATKEKRARLANLVLVDDDAVSTETPSQT